MSGNTPEPSKNNHPTPSVSDVSNDLRAVRLLRLQELRAQGHDPFQANWAQTHTSKQALEAFVEGQDPGPEVSIAGRIVMQNDMGKSSFVKLLDRDGRIQAYVRKDVVGDEAYAAFKKLDLGDIVGIAGTLFKTKTGEITVRATRYALVAKALRPLPEKWHGLTDSDQIYRQRYLDLIVNDESRQRFQL
ncbi:MAG TPA: OB-fold nucleic acid binding domain-containing protein, partial [Opitutales bacterium]|nr:OB-fold nucleic acid binding domain-containing protein [Opitutales bacterium]